MADRDADGKMDANEFSIAMHLIELKIKGFDIPKALPPSMVMPVAIIPGMQAFRPPVALAGNFFYYYSILLMKLITIDYEW